MNALTNDTFFQKIGILIIVILLALYALLSFLGFQETHDAKVVEAVQVNLQESVASGMAQLDLPAKAITPANIVNAARIKFPKGVLVDKKMHLLIPRTQREAQFEITDKGEVNVVALTNFNRFHLEAGRIVRNNRWLMPFDKPGQPAPAAEGPGADG